MPIPKKLIEVALPIKEISAESVRDKSIRHGHISTLHLWWARRPLPVCRAIVFASLVPDPLDPNCPKAFNEAVQLLLAKPFALVSGGTLFDWYKPYDDIPYTAAIDQMEDNLRNRLLMFIGKFSNYFCDNEKTGKTTAAKDLLSDASLIKWDNKNNERIIGLARKLIWVAHNSKTSDASAEVLLADFEYHYQAIKAAENELYTTTNRHIHADDVSTKETALHNAIEAFLNKMPRVFDPFAGGGAIPLEAARLGCRSFGNDINPVAHIIQKGSVEFPQKFGKPITYTRDEFINIYGRNELEKYCTENSEHPDNTTLLVHIPNRLSFDVAYYANKLIAETEKEIGHFYPADEMGNKPIAYYWARVGSCSNPSCKAEVPLLKSFYLANTKTKLVHLNPIINNKLITFEIKAGKSPNESWLHRGNLQCPVCGNTTDVNALKQQFLDKKTSERLIAVIEEGQNSKLYRLPTNQELSILDKVPTDIERPNEPMPVKYTQALPACTWGFVKWSDLLTNRQNLLVHIIIRKFLELSLSINFENDYSTALKTFLAILIDRIAVANTSFGIWHSGRETLERIMGRQAISMVFDYPESNPFCSSSGSALNQLDWLTRYIESESNQPFSTELKNASSGEKSQFSKKYLSAVVTDPPYYDAIAYADLSDFFYVWLKRTLGEVFPLNFATPQTPKSEECTALKHHHNGNLGSAKVHFENKLLQIFDAIELQTTDMVSIMFAHQSTEAWTTLCNSILGARMNITGSWATDTEMTGALKTDKSFLSSSVTVSARPSQSQGIGNYREVKKAVEARVALEVEELYSLGFRGADLLTACFGQAVSVFGKFEKVVKADGTEVTVAELLEMARESAFNALLKGFDGDDFTKFYIGWLQLYGFTESEFDDAAKFSRVGLSINVNELFTEHILIKNGNKQTLSAFADRIKADKNLGLRADNHLIDNVHKAMDLYQGTNRKDLLQYIAHHAPSPDNSFWRVITSLCEVLPAGSNDLKQALGLLTNKDSLIRESKSFVSSANDQMKLDI